MTEELFLKDSYTKEFEARVVRLEGREVILDRTAFYPGGGGQPPDKGVLGIGPIKAVVVDARVTGGQMRADRARMDFSFPGEWTAEAVGEIERLTNASLAQERPVRVYELAREEALENPDLIRTQVNLVPERVKMIRIVEIENLDTQADGGTHVANTREVGRMEITGHKSKGRQNKRIEFVLR